jgi:hypothetical protein
MSIAGSTIGHFRANLRVVDNRTDGNISFVKAVVRVIIKGVLGIYSFITMATTSRHQALHDLLTRSTVQIRDLSKARPHHCVQAHMELSNPTMPSAWRRILGIILYLAAVWVVALLVGYGIRRAGLLSNACFTGGRCSPSENLTQLVMGLCLIGISIVCIIQGWRGGLFGCRIQVARAPNEEIPGQA